jgi:hypothetical protein
MAYPDAFIYNLSTTDIERVNYYDTEHYRVLRDFIADPKRMLDVLLETTSNPSPQRTSKNRRR